MNGLNCWQRRERWKASDEPRFKGHDGVLEVMKALASVVRPLWTVPVIKSSTLDCRLHFKVQSFRQR